MLAMTIQVKIFFTKSLGGEIGRHKGLKIPRLYRRAGSTPARGTNYFKQLLSTSLGESKRRWHIAREVETR